MKEYERNIGDKRRNMNVEIEGVNSRITQSLSVTKLQMICVYLACATCMIHLAKQGFCNDSVALEHFPSGGVCRLEQITGCDGKFGDIRHH